MFADEDSDQPTHEDEQTFVAYIGPTIHVAPNATDEGKATDKLIEQQIEVLKAATLLKEINGKPITRKVLLETILILNQECEFALGKLSMVHRIKSCDPRKSRFWTKKVYCEDPNLQLGSVNGYYLALIIDRNNTPMMTMEQKQLWIDYCITFLDIENFVPTGPAQRKTVQNIIEKRDAPNRLRKKAIVNHVFG